MLNILNSSRRLDVLGPEIKATRVKRELKKIGKMALLQSAAERIKNQFSASILEIVSIRDSKQRIESESPNKKS
jgi:hypothetical protein